MTYMFKGLSINNVNMLLEISDPPMQLKPFGEAPIKKLRVENARGGGIIPKRI